VPGYFNSLLNETTSAQAQQQMFSANNSEFQGSLFEDVLANSPTSAIVTGMDLAYASDDFTFKSSETLNPQEANEKYGLKGELKFSSPIKESAAKIMYDRKYYELQRREVLGQGTSGQNLVGFGTGMAATLIDPLNIALSLAIPPVAEMKLANLAGSNVARQVGAKVVGGALDAGLAVAAGQGLTAAALNGTQADYTMNTALRDTAMGMVLGGAVHGGLATYKASRGLPVTDFMSKTKPETQLHAQVAAANDLLNGRTVTSPQQLIPLDENLTRAKAENTDQVRALNQETVARDPLKPSGPREAPQFFDPEFKFREGDNQLIPAAIQPVGQTAAAKGYVSIKAFIADAGDALNEVLVNHPNSPEISPDQSYLKVFADARNQKYGGRLTSKEFFDWLNSDAVFEGLKFTSKEDEASYRQLVSDLRAKSLKAKQVAEAAPQQIPAGYESVTLRPGELNLEDFREAGPRFDNKRPSDETVYAPAGAIKPQTLRKIISNNRQIGGYRIGYEGFKDIWKYLTELGLKEEDLDQGVVQTAKTPGGRNLRGIQTNAQLLVGDMRNFVIRITDIEAGQRPEVDVPGLTTVSINNRTFKLPIGDGATKKIKVDISERVYITREVALMRYFMSKGMDKWQAIDKIASLTEDEIMRLGANEANEFAKKIKEEAYSALAKKAVMANMGFSDVHEYNIGARIFDDPKKPADWLVLDKGYPLVNYGDIYEKMAEEGGIVPNKFDPAQKIAYEEYKRNKKAAIEAAQLERLNAQREDIINREQVKIIREQLDNLKQQLQKKPESTWWKPGDEAPVETAAKETVTQDSLKAPQDLERDFNNLSMDTEEFINRFKNEMSETDLAKLAEFDKLAGDAEKAKPGFAQAALCVIRNLV